MSFIKWAHSIWKLSDDDAIKAGLTAMKRLYALNLIRLTNQFSEEFTGTIPKIYHDILFQYNYANPEARDIHIAQCFNTNNPDKFCELFDNKHPFN